MDYVSRYALPVTDVERKTFREVVCHRSVARATRRRSGDEAMVVVRVATENVPFLITVASTTVKDLFSKVDRPLFLSLYPSFSLLLSFLHHVPSFTPYPHQDLSLLQIGLVVLRVHQDNSPAWLCVSSKRTLQAVAKVDREQWDGRAG